MVRYKKRYLVCEIILDNPKKYFAMIQDSVVRAAVTEAVKTSFGDAGVARLNTRFKIVYCNAKTNVFVIQLAREAAVLVQAALCFVKTVGNERCVIRTAKVAGTLRTCYKFLIAYRAELLPIFYKHFSQLSQSVSSDS